MSATRREFIKQVGITLASMMMARCQVDSPRQPAPGPTPNPTVPPSPTPGCAPFEATGDSPRKRLRSCWTSLNWLAERAQSGFECGDPAREQLVAAHRAALDDLVDTEGLETEAGEYVQAALERDIAFLGPTHGGWTEPTDWPTDWPDFDELDLEIDPEATEAAACLAQLLSGQ